MAEIALGAPLTMTDAVLTIGTNGYSKIISKAEIGVNQNGGVFKPIGGGTTPVAAPSDYVLNLEFAQDWKTTSSLSKYLWDNAGTTASVTLVPQSGGPTVTGTVMLHEPSALGGPRSDGKPVPATATLEFTAKPTIA